MAPFNCGIEALIFGSFTILASGFLTSSPRSSKSLVTCWLSSKNSGKVAKILAAKEISLVSISIPEDFTKAFTIGNKERVAKAGASSVFVYMILEIGVVFLYFNGAKNRS
jgi:hypothetical protein